jgi:hypothetical protein
VRAAVRAINPRAVVLGGTTAGPIASHWDGGLAGDFSRELPTAHGADLPLLASPVRAAYPHVSISSNGRNLNQLHQVFAAGHGLALNPWWPGAPDGGRVSMLAQAAHIRALVLARQRFKDALVYDDQLYQPVTHDPTVAAYRYRGSSHDVVTIVGTDQTPRQVDLQLRGEQDGAWWRDILAEDESFQLVDHVLAAITMPAISLRILVRQADRPSIGARVLP